MPRFCCAACNCGTKGNEYGTCRRKVRPEFGKRFAVVGFDVNARRLEELRAGKDRTLEVSGEELALAKGLQYTGSVEDLRDADVFVVTVPTPIDRHRRPDLTPLVRGGRIGTVQYHVAQVLHIKPLITVSKSGETAGTYVPAGRVRRLDKAVNAFVEQIVKEVGEGQKLRAHIVYGTDPTPALADRLSEMLRQRFDCVYLERSVAGPILAVHTGTVAFDIGYAAGDWPV